MPNLATIDPRRAATKISETCSPELWRRLTNETLSWGEACAALAESPETMVEVATVADRLQAAIEPCGDRVVIEALTPLLALYNVPRKTEQEAAMFWRFYLDTLSGFPAEAVRAGVSDYVADAKSEWFPKPGPLKALCERRAIPLRMAASRAAKALQIARRS